MRYLRNYNKKNYCLIISKNQHFTIAFKELTNVKNTLESIKFAKNKKFIKITLSNKITIYKNKIIIVKLQVIIEEISSI